jgi:hypothetical protein
VTNSQLADLGQYLARRGFTPSPADSAWLDRDTGHQVIRVLHEPGETTFLYYLDPHGVCLYEARFSPGTPDGVITATIDAAPSPPRPGAPVSGPGRPRVGGARAKGNGDPR